MVTVELQIVLNTIFEGEEGERFSLYPIGRLY